LTSALHNKNVPTGSSDDIINLEVEGLANLFKGDYDNTPILGGQVAGRIHSIPTVADQLASIVDQAEERLRSMQSYLL
jgi:NAD(P)H-dependent flavin oxidoreductase YrpB (nitropropane dioxygenase family)